jgi:hypothetical protein
MLVPGIGTVHWVGLFHGELGNDYRGLLGEKTGTSNKNSQIFGVIDDEFFIITLGAHNFAS